MWDKIMKKVAEENEKQLSVLSEKAREIVVLFLQAPFQQKDITIEKIKFLREKDLAENQIYYDEAIDFIQNM